MYKMRWNGSIFVTPCNIYYILIVKMLLFLIFFDNFTLLKEVKPVIISHMIHLYFHTCEFAYNFAFSWSSSFTHRRRGQRRGGLCAMTEVQKSWLQPQQGAECRMSLSSLLHWLRSTRCDHLEVTLWHTSRAEVLLCGWSIRLVSHNKPIKSWWVRSNDRYPRTENWKWHQVLLRLFVQSELKNTYMDRHFKYLVKTNNST